MYCSWHWSGVLGTAKVPGLLEWMVDSGDWEEVDEVVIVMPVAVALGSGG